MAVLAVAVVAVAFGALPGVPTLAVVALSIGLLLHWRSQRRDRPRLQRDRGGTDDRLCTRTALPEHPEPGEYHCQECGACVTVGPSGTEYGHAAGIAGVGSQRCPRRPASVDPRPATGGETA